MTDGYRAKTEKIHNGQLAEICLSRPRVLLLGDSYFHRLCWSKPLKDMLPKEYGILAVGGDRIEGLVWCINNTPSFPSSVERIVVFIGINDLMHGVTTEQIVSGLTSVFSILRHRLPGVTLNLMDYPSPPKVPPTLDLNSRIESIGVPVIRPWNFKPEFVDGVHLTADSYKMMINQLDTGGVH